jgi:hypothetical protein
MKLKNVSIRESPHPYIILPVGELHCLRAGYIHCAWYVHIITLEVVLNRIDLGIWRQFLLVIVAHNYLLPLW